MTTFNPQPAWPRVATTSPASVGMPVKAGQGTGVRTGAFQQVLADVQPSGKQVTVERGDTLIGMIKTHFRENQTPITEGQAMRLSQDVAKNNQLHNPNRIQPGQVLDLSALSRPAAATAALPTLSTGLSAAEALAARSASLSQAAPATASSLQTTDPQEAAETGATAQAAPAADNSHPVLERTLGRAVDKGFVATKDLPAVRDKVMALAQRYNFAPDDFARLTLMESGGMNPQASNGSCHGIIQFCDGANRGAAAVGLKNNPRSILGMGLLQQLDLVDRYFSQAGLPTQSQGPGQTNGQKMGLDDLYLTVLTPAARQETRPNAPLPIAGPQARHLHVGGDSRKPITRNSIMSGLHAMTDSLLGLAQSKIPGSRWYADAAKTTPASLR